MGRAVNCVECGKVFNDLKKLEDLRENDSICLVCNTPIEVADWDLVLASYDDEDLDDLDETDIDEGLDEDFDDWEEELDDDDFGEGVDVPAADADDADAGDDPKDET